MSAIRITESQCSALAVLSEEKHMEIFIYDGFVGSICVKMRGSGPNQDRHFIIDKQGNTTELKS